MYVREETIEEENLDWGELTEASKENQDKLLEDMKEEAAKDPSSKQKTILLNNRDNSINTAPRSTLKNELSDLFKQNAEISLLLGIVFVPYILGFAISYFLFYFYGGMSISNFLGVQEVPTIIELWSIGAYLLITVGTVLAFFIP
ncbi:hypothetical protein MN086_06125 [Sulfurovum sp. XGS-02]|uniref:hypothetical protein n=1 Tax=Sulfurovum sp. XGS-02 TaxID=2925411 RepID=UPI002062DDAD|nr:hypothetical protein [Sulfurovum sp. XGS-02]UPT76631.1 hypothetical protein MN086_06125 [Sulfurovum sp. XGS-02]